MAQVWMHNGFLQVEGQKMSKSLGNFLTIHQLLADWPGDVLRFNMLRTHYRQPIDWTVKSLEESWRILEGFFNNAGSVHAEPGHIHASVLEALLDDLNTPKAIAELHALDRPGAQNDLGVTLKSLGFSGDLATPGADLTIDGAAVAALVEARLAARRARNWAESDRIRDELAAMGIAIKDNKDGTTTWEMKR
jgi:cysteinyl-tRNA synthetase